MARLCDGRCPHCGSSDIQAARVVEFWDHIIHGSLGGEVVAVDHWHNPADPDSTRTLELHEVFRCRQCKAQVEDQ